MKKIIKKQNGGSAPTGTLSWFLTYGGNIASNLLDKLPNSGLFLNGNNFEMGQVRGGVSNILLSSGNPYAMVGGLLYGIGNKAGVFGDSSQGLGTWNDLGNAVLSLIPGGGLIPKTENFKISKEAEYLGPQAYAGTFYNDLQKTKRNSGLRILFGRNKYNNMLNKAKELNKKLETIGTGALNDSWAVASNAQNMALQDKHVKSGGYRKTSLYGKLGMKIEKVKQISSQIKDEKNVFKPTSAEDDKAFFDSLIFDETPIFQEGGSIKKVKSDKSYYDKNNNTIYYTDDEAFEHENFHANPDKELLKLLEPYYLDLDDNKISELGGDLQFVKRFENDPGYFYSPEEIGARITAAKFKTKGQQYTPLFFAELRKNENQYGDNMRDLLHMYNDENLSKIFNLNVTTLQFQEGGKSPSAPKLNSVESGESPIGFSESGIPLYLKGDGTIGPVENIGENNLFDLIKNSNANFAKRLQDPNRKFIKLENGEWGNFKLAWSEDETGVIVYPEIQEIDGKLIDLSNDRDKAWESAIKHKDYVYFPSREAAEWFTTHYKDYYKGFLTEPQTSKEPLLFKEGGQMNVIPEGSLHARLHHMEGADNLTKKGIPVVDNEGNQLAEVERAEIIFNKEVTDKLEELLKKFNSEEHTAKEKDDFAIEAGKLLSTQIIENTDDRAGLINKVENELILSNN